MPMHVFYLTICLHIQIVLKNILNYIRIYKYYFLISHQDLFFLVTYLLLFSYFGSNSYFFNIVELLNSMYVKWIRKSIRLRTRRERKSAFSACSEITSLMESLKQSESKREEGPSLFKSIFGDICILKV